MYGILRFRHSITLIWYFLIPYFFLNALSPLEIVRNGIRSDLMPNFAEKVECSDSGGILVYATKKMCLDNFKYTGVMSDETIFLILEGVTKHVWISWKNGDYYHQPATLNAQITVTFPGFEIRKTTVKNLCEFIEKNTIRVELGLSWKNILYKPGTSKDELIRTFLNHWTREVFSARECYDIGVEIAKGRIYMGNAVGFLKQATRLDPNYTAAYCTLGKVYMYMERYEEALEMFNKAEQLKPDSGGVYLCFGHVYGRLGRLKDSEEAFKKAITIEPNLVDAYVNLGVTYLHLDRKTEAIESFKEAIRIDSNNVDAHYRLAGTYLTIGDKNAARVEYEILKGLDASRANEIYKGLKE